jgi:hypothetical protein
VTELRAAAGRGDDDPISIAWLAHAKALAGERDQARRIVAKLEAELQSVYVPAIISRSRTPVSEIAPQRSTCSKRRAPSASLR